MTVKGTLDHIRTWGMLHITGWYALVSVSIWAKYGSEVASDHAPFSLILIMAIYVVLLHVLMFFDKDKPDV